MILVKTEDIPLVDHHHQIHVCKKASSIPPLKVGLDPSLTRSGGRGQESTTCTLWAAAVQLRFQQGAVVPESVLWKMQDNSDTCVYDRDIAKS